MLNRSFVSLVEAEQAAVWLRIVERSGTDQTSASVLAKRLGMFGRRLLLVSIAIEVYEAEDKPREVARQGTMAVVGALGALGGWAGDSGAVAAGVRAATAPVCVGAVAVVGGILCAFGSDLAFGTIYPRPARRLE